MIRFINVSKRYPNGHDAIKHVNLHIKRGEMAFLTGHSGAGKSTLLKLISLIERPTQGQVFVDGKHLNRVTHGDIPYLRRSMGVIFQNPRLLVEQTVFDNVALPLVISGYRHQEIGSRTRAALDKVGLLSKERMRSGDLSLGEQQRVGIARAVVNKPRLLIADEPTGNLDPELSQEIMSLFNQFKKVGVSVLVASHDIALIAGFKHRILTLKEGELIGGSKETQDGK